MYGLFDEHNYITILFNFLNYYIVISFLLGKTYSYYLNAIMSK